MSLDQTFQPLGKGDRTILSFPDRERLENEILPTARKWLKHPGLKSHGEATLNYWGERHD